MLAQLFRRQSSAGLVSSSLYDGATFYRAFERDLLLCKTEVLLESPFMTRRRLDLLIPTLQKLRRRGVKITVNTKHPEEHESYLKNEAYEGISLLQDTGIVVLYTGGHHRKLAIIDRQILWEGSLNILSQSNSCEIMRRIASAKLAEDMLRFIKITKL